MEGKHVENILDRSVAEATEKTTSKAWAVMLSVFLAGIVMAYAQYKLTPIVGIVQADLGLTKAGAGWVISVFNILGLLLAFPAVGLIRKWGVVKGGLISLAVTLVGTVIGYFAGGQALLLVSRVIEGFGIGLISVIAPTMIAMWFPIKKRGLPMGIWSAWQMVAVAAVFTWATNIIDVFQTWKGMWTVGVILLIIGIVVYALVVRLPPADQNHADSEDTSVSLYGALKYKSVYIVSIAGLGFGIACTVFVTWIATYWITVGGLAPEMALRIVAGVFAGEIVTCCIFGLVLNKIKNRRKFQVVASVLYAVVYLLSFQMHSFSGIIFVAITYAIVEGAFTAAMWTLISQTTPDPRLAGSAIAAFTVAINLGMVIGAPIGGAVIDAYGWLAVSILVCVAQLVAAFGYGFLKLYNAKGEVVHI